MKILQISPYDNRGKVGGSQNFCFELSKRLHEHGHDVEVWTSRLPSSLSKVDYKMGFPILRFFTPMNIWQMNPTTFLFPQIFRKIDEFDLVHAHSYVFASSNQVAFYRKLKRFKFVLHLHGGLGDLSGAVVGKWKFVAKRFFDSTVGKATIKSADAVISVSKADADYVKDRYGVDCVVVPNAVDTSEFKESRGGDCVYIGRLTTWKGCMHLPSICRALGERGVKVKIAGYGPLSGYLKRYCGDNVTFLGRVPKQNIPHVLEGASCLLLPSFVEGLPTVILEALSAGVPSVVYDVGGCSEVVRDGVTGFTVPVGEIYNFVDKTFRVLENSGRFKEDCLRIARTEYDWSVVTSKILDVYQNV